MTQSPTARRPDVKTAITNEPGQFDRAYVQSKVIESNLQHLSETLSELDPALRDDVRSYADRFEAYVRRLGDAAGRASGEL